MRTTVYKRFFEIRILHDYFLSDDGGIPYSAMSAQRQASYLSDVLASGRYDIHRIISIEPTREMREVLRNYRMKMVPTPMGFFLGMEVNQAQNGTTLYEPFISLNGGLSLSFALKPKDEIFYSYTNVPLREAFPAKWYFTNKFTQGEKSPGLKVLTSVIPEKGTATYEMGTLVREGNQTQEAYLELDGTEGFLNVAGDGFVTEKDRILLPKRFDFDLGKTIADEVLIVLSDGATEVKTIRKAAGKPARFVRLDFEKKEDVDKTPIPDGKYTLRVTGEAAGRQILLNDKLYDKKAFGAIEIFPDAGHPDFNLLDGEGKLLTRIDGQRNKVPHPVFELRFASRKAYWRYRSKEPISDIIISSYQDYLKEWDSSEKKILVSKVPLAFSQTFSRFNEMLLPPQPSPYLLRREGGKYFTDIHLSSVSKFTIE